MDDAFSKLARKIERLVGSPWAFVVACILVLLWLLTGPLFDFSDTWQIAINTLTTIITFLIVFLIQATQTRDTLAIHVKLDELLRADKQARTPVALAEDLPRRDLDRLHNELQEEAKREPLRPNDEFKPYSG